MELNLPEKLYYNIGEISKAFNIKPSLLRFWEKEFDILTPKKNISGTRKYSSVDLKNIKLIYDLVKVKGMLINPEVVTDLLLTDGQVGEFQIIVDKEVQNDPLSADRLRLLLDIDPKTDIERIAETIRVAIGVRPIIELSERTAIFDPDKSLKAKRFVDLRSQL